MGGYSILTSVSLQILSSCSFIILIFHIVCDWSIVTRSCWCVWLCLLSSCQCSILLVLQLEKWTEGTVGTSSFPVQIHIFRWDSVAQHCLLQLSVPLSCELPRCCGNHLMQSLLRTEGSNLWQVWHSPDIFSSWMDLHGFSVLPVRYYWSQTSK